MSNIKKENLSYFDIKTCEININIQPKKNSDPFTIAKYKEYFKSFIKFKKSNNHQTHLNSMYLQFRDKYQKFVTNKNNSLGLRLKGNKIYENLPLNIFKNNYIISTSNLSKELEDKSLGYLIPSGRLSPEKKVEKDKEKLKLTPIPFKNKILISGEEERKKIKEAQKSAVLMRRVEYTHYIKKNKSKNNIDSNAINFNDKVYILKGAIIIIEDWWKNIKYRRKIMKSRKFKNGRNIYDKNSELDRKTKTININIEPNEIKSEKLLSKINININKEINSSNNNLIHQRPRKRPSKPKIESSYTVDSNNFEKTSSNINFAKFSNNNFNKSTELNSNKFNSYKNIESTLKNQKQEILIDNRILSDKEKKKNKVSSNIKLNKKANTRNVNIRNKKKEQINNNTSKSISNINNNSIIIESINKIKAKIYNAINKNHYHNHIKNKRNKLFKLKADNISINKSTNDKTFKKNISLKNDNNNINNIKNKNHLKQTEFFYDYKDIEKLNISINSNRTKNSEKNKRKVIDKKPETELIIKTNYDIDRKTNLISVDIIKHTKSCDYSHRRWKNKNIEKINFRKRYNSVNNTDINYNLFNCKYEKNYDKVKYVESQENENKLIILDNDKNNVKEKDNNINDEKEEDNNNIKISIDINKNDNLINLKNDELKFIEDNKNNFEIIKDENDKKDENKINMSIENNKLEIKNNNLENKINISIENDKLENKKNDIESKINTSIENNKLENKINDLENKIQEIDINDNDNIKKMLKRCRTYSFNNEHIKDENHYRNKKEYENNILNKIQHTQKNKSQRHYNVYKIEGFSFLNKITQRKEFNNLEITDNKEILFMQNPKPKPQVKENITKNFELEFIPNKRNKLSTSKEFKIENNYFVIKNENPDNSKQNNISFSINKLQIELKSENKNNDNNNISIINTQTDNSEILPIEEDSIFNIKVEIPVNGKNQFSTDFNFSLENKNSMNNGNKLYNIKNNNINDKNDFEEDISDASFGELNINIPKTGKYNLCQKIKELFPQNNTKIIIEKENKNKNCDKNINKNQNEINNNINIKNFEVKKENNHFINYNNYKRAKSENKRNENPEKKGYYKYTNIPLEVTNNIKDIYKIYKTKSDTYIQTKKTKNYEYLRTLHNKFEFEI